MVLPIRAKKPAIGPLAMEFHLTLHFGGDIEADYIFRHSYKRQLPCRALPCAGTQGVGLVRNRPPIAMRRTSRDASKNAGYRGYMKKRVVAELFSES